MSTGPFAVKIVVIGDGAVGKTSLRRRFLGQGFNASYLETLGADFAVKHISFDDVSFKCDIWDLAGQPQFQYVRKMYYKGAMGALIIYDVSRYASFESVPHWLEELWKSNEIGMVPAVLIGNKLDLRIPGIHAVPTESGSQYAADVSNMTRKFGFEIPYIETSAKHGTNVNEAFYLLIRNIFSYLVKKQEPKTE